VTVSIAEVGRHGRLDVAFAVRNGRTEIRHSYCEVPFKITRLHEADATGFAHLILMQCTAGLFGGDAIESEIHLDAGARVVLTQQSATKIHPSGDRSATQRTRIHVESGAELIVDFEPVIPFAGSRLHQSMRVELEPGASLVYWDGMMAGRLGKDERWQFSELSMELRIEREGRPLFLERYFLVPSQQNPESGWVMNTAGYLGTGICFKEGAAQLAGDLHDAMPGAGVDVLGPDVLAARVAVESGPEFHRLRETFRRLSANFVLPTG